jgi:hypothetical protein
MNLGTPITYMHTYILIHDGTVESKAEYKKIVKSKKKAVPVTGLGGL